MDKSLNSLKNELPLEPQLKLNLKKMVHCGTINRPFWPFGVHSNWTSYYIICKSVSILKLTNLDFPDAAGRAPEKQFCFSPEGADSPYETYFPIACTTVPCL